MSPARPISRSTSMTATLPAATTATADPPPAIAADHRSIGPLTIQAASIRGFIHGLLEPRQDAYAISHTADLVAVAVADGIGSLQLSHFGAVAAAQAAAAAAVTPADATEIVAHAQAAIAATAADRDVDPQCLGTTLALVVIPVKAASDGTRSGWILTIGDSPVLQLINHTWATLAAESDDGPVNPVHAWLPDHPGDIAPVPFALPAGGALVVATDGFAVPLDGDPSLADHLADRWDHGPRSSLLQFVLDMSFDAHWDDRTAVVIWAPEDPPTPPEETSTIATDEGDVPWV